MNPVERAVQAVEQILVDYIDPYESSYNAFGVAEKVVPAALAAAGIPWEPIATMPDDRKDGRPMLLWEHDVAIVGRWDAERAGWEEPESMRLLEAISYWADINPPE